VLARRGTDVVNRIQTCSGNAGAGVHAATVDAYVKAARPDAEAGAVQAKIEMDTGDDLDSAAETEGHV
jgi:hypothetical protein